MRYVIAVLLAAWVGGAACNATGQVWSDGFDTYTGTKLGNWVEYRGDWIVSATGRAEAEAKFRWQYALQTQRIQRDCALQCLVVYNRGVSHTLQFGGLTLRCNDPAFPGNNAAADLLMVKVQNNDFSNSPDRFDSLWIYELDRTGEDLTSNLQKLTPTFASAMVRMLVIDGRVVARADTNGDGVWEHSVERNVALPPKAGPIGIAGFGGAHVDDFVLFDAVLLDSPLSPKPAPGKTVLLVLRGAPLATYQAAASFGVTGIPVAGGRRIPLALDPLLVLTVSNTLPSVFIGLRGVTDAKGDAQVSIAIPNLAALKGVTFFNAFVNLNAGQISRISNDHAVIIG